MNFRDELNNYVKAVNELCEEMLSMDAGYADYLLEAMKYAVMGGGKRLRPILMQETGKLFSEDIPEMKYFMAAIEMIHSYSLVHDDMPCASK